jgi:predicted proteasome-type protease
MASYYGRGMRAGLSRTFIFIALLAGCGDGDSTATVTPPVDTGFISFHSDATNLVANDTNSLRDVFIHDGLSGQTIRVSVSTSGFQTENGASEFPSAAVNGRFVAFQSDATNLVPNDVNGFRDIFVHDSQTGQTTRVNVSSAGNQALGGGSERATLSADGRFVAFESDATNLVAGDTNGLRDIFVRDTQATPQTTIRVNVSSITGLQALGGNSGRAAISADGRFVVFESDATNLVSGDTNGQRDIFVHNRDTGETTRVNVSTAGGQALSAESGWPVISANGRFVAFQSDAPNLVTGDTNGVRDIFVRDTQIPQTTIRVNVSNAGLQAQGGMSEKAVISGDGRFIAFHSDAPNLVTNDTNGLRDIFIRDTQLEQTTRVNVASNGNQAQGGISEYPTLSADGRFVAWHSDAVNLVQNDTNGLRDIFVRDRQTGQTIRINTASNGNQALEGGSFDPSF